MSFDDSIDRSGTSSLKYDARQAVFGREDVIPLWVADMDFAAPVAVSEALVKRAQHPIYGYTQFPPSTYTALQSWCQQRYNWKINRGSIVMCPGVVPSLHAVIEALTEPGDKVIVQPPVYFPFFSAVTETGRSLLLNPLRLCDGRYQMDLADLEACARQGAKLILLCSPHNPVGRVWTAAELSAMAEIARTYAMTIVSDEIHADLIYPGYQHFPLANLVEDVPVITAVSPSKTFNIPGLGLSSLIINNAEQRQAVKRVFESRHVSATNPFSICAFEAAYQHGASWLDELMLYLQQTTRYVADFIADNIPSISLIEPQGTYLLWLDCRALHLQESELKQLFIEKAGVGLSPGSLFGEVGQGFMRMNIAVPRQLIETSLQRIAAAINN